MSRDAASNVSGLVSAHVIRDATSTVSGLVSAHMSRDATSTAIRELASAHRSRDAASTAVSSAQGQKKEEQKDTHLEAWARVEQKREVG